MRNWHWLSLGVAIGMFLSVGFGFALLQQSSGSGTVTSALPDKEAATSPATAAEPAHQLQLAQAAGAPSAGNSSPPADDGKLRVVAFGAHPDDCELDGGGTAAMWSDLGHHVKLVSVTNGDIGHWAMAGGALAQRRYAEVQQVAKILGTTTVVLDIHDGELVPALEYRKMVTKEIRNWGADVVLAHRPNDYHPDHRYTGVLVQDAAFMVQVPFFCPDVPHLTRNPVFMYFHDPFQRPNPFRPDVVVAIDGVIERKLDAVAAMESQFFEGGALGHAGLIPRDEAGRVARQREVRERFRQRFARIADDYRQKLVELYGEKQGNAIRYAEAFEVCEYGRQPTAAELRKLFPFFPEKP